MAAITIPGENLIARKQGNNEVLTIDRMVLANIPGLNPDDPVDREQQMPPENQIVLNEKISQFGSINPNLVVYSLMLGTGGETFDFNWLGLYASEDDVIIAISYLPTQSKDPSVSMTRNFMLEFSGATETTDINIDAESWQVDYSARVNGMDEQSRIVREDVFGRQLFHADTCKVVKGNDGYYEVLAGERAYVAGIQFSFPGKKILVSNIPTCVWVDISVQGSAMSHNIQIVEVVVSFQDLHDYIKDDRNHYVEKISTIDLNGLPNDNRCTFDAINNAGFTHDNMNSVTNSNNTHRNYIRTGKEGGVIYKKESIKKVANIEDLKGNIFNKSNSCPPNISLSKGLFNSDVVQNLPVRFPDYDEIINKYGYNYIFPQCAVVFEDIIYICYLSSGGDSSPPWIAKYQFLSGQYLGCFSAGYWISEGIEVLRKNGVLTLFIRGHDNSIEEFNIENTNNMEVLEYTNQYDINMHSMFFHREGKIYVSARHQVGHTTTRDIFHIYDLNFNFEGIVQLDKYSASLTGGTYENYFHKIQAFTSWNGYIIGGFGGTYSPSNGTPTTRQMQGVKAFSMSGELVAEALWNPQTAMDAFKKIGVRTTIMEQEGVFSYENRLFSIMVTHSHSNTEYAYDEGIVILELNNGDTLGLENHKAPLLPNPKNIEYVMQASFNSRLLNPVTGIDMTTIKDVITYMRNAGITHYEFYSSGLNPAITDFNGNNIPSGNFVKIYGVNGFTYRMEQYGSTSVRSFWIMPNNDSQVETREKYIGGIWSFCDSTGEEFVRFSGAKNIYLTGAVVETTNIRPKEDGIYSLGEPNRQWNNLYIKNSNIYDADYANKATDEIPASWFEAAKNIKPFRYKYLDKNDGARWHIGYSAEQVFKCLIDADVEDPWQISFMCKDSITKELEDGTVIPIINDETGKQKEKWGLRVSELNTLIIHSNK